MAGIDCPGGTKDDAVGCKTATYGLVYSFHPSATSRAFLGQIKELVWSITARFVVSNVPLYGYKKGALNQPGSLRILRYNGYKSLENVVRRSKIMNCRCLY